MTPVKYSTVFLPLILITQLVYGQNSDWKQEESGGVSVKSKFESVDGKTTAYYIATKSAPISIQAAEKFLRNAANYKLFMANTEESESIEIRSQNEWLMYLYFDAPWPMPNSDCVQKVEVLEADDTSLAVRAESVQHDFRKHDVQRMQFLRMKYSFRQLSNNQIEITIDAGFTPTTEAPEWMLKAWFPSGPEAIMNNLIKHISEYK